MIQDKIDLLLRRFATPHLEISGPDPDITNRDGPQVWQVGIGERLGRKLYFHAPTIEDALDIALAEFARKGINYGKPEKRR